MLGCNKCLPMLPGEWSSICTSQTHRRRESVARTTEPLYQEDVRPRHAGGLRDAPEVSRA